MSAFLSRTFGGLSKPYYFRQLTFGLIFPALLIAVALNSPRGLRFATALLFLANTLLYPYSRFVYEGIVGFVLGKNVLIVNALLMLIAKFISMAICWCFAVFIAPVGLAYLYFRQGNNSNQSLPPA